MLSSPLGDLPSQVGGLAQRLRLPTLERHHNNRAVIAAYVLINSAITVALLSAIAMVTGQPFVFPSLGPTAFLLFFSALSASASPRNVFCGHLIGVLAGVMGLLIFGLQAVPADLDDINAARLGAVAFALSVTLAVMILFGVPHAPAGATTLIVALGLLRTPSQLMVLMFAVVILILQGLAINRLAGLAVPWWKPAKVPDPQQ
ncbi:MAG TPA: HPP family protein [Actinobacteria bacterium]|jgi:CBS-domain-containing membrane protein|nr:HPP family protein [Actinomycetota bacterium]